MKALENYYKALDKMCIEFRETYLGEEEGDIPDYYIIGGDNIEKMRCGPSTVCFQEEYYFNPEQIFECLLHEIPKETRQEWHDTDTDINLVTFSKGLREYSKEDKEKDEETIKQIAEELANLINKHKSK